jgi:hypothetical protein
MIIAGPAVVITLLICWSCLIQVSRGVLVRADRLPVASAQNVANELSCLHLKQIRKLIINKDYDKIIIIILFWFPKGQNK